ncbi:N-acetylmuramoyl-L-alanine amidase family protein [Deinococcus yavapaiensis]|nr:N-acetylmuramoyl-L-alanine amidase [Deinococcus yavapaiensis]
MSLLLVSGALAQPSPFLNTPPPSPATPVLTPLPSTTTVPATPLQIAPQMPLLGVPRTSNAGGVTRFVLDLPPGASYTLTPTFGGLRVDVTDVRTAPASGRNVSAELTAWSYQPTTTGVTVLLETPFPLGLDSGWRALDVPPDGVLPHRLALDLGALLQGGATGEAAKALRTTPPVTIPQQTPPTQTAPTPTEPSQTPPSSESSRVPATPVTPFVPATPVTPSVPSPTLPSGALLPLTPPRVGKNSGFTRIVLDLPPNATYALVQNSNSVRVDLRGVTALAEVAQPDTPELAQWQIEPTLGGITLTLRPTFALTSKGGMRQMFLPPVDASSTLNRLVIDLSPAFSDTSPLSQADTTLPSFPTPVKIVLDAGHGGVDPGAQQNTIVEKAVTLDVAQRVKALLTAAGATVVMTRDTDTQLSVDKNTDLDMRASMAAPPVNVLVSIHVNSIAPENTMKGYGVETWWYPNNDLSPTLASSLQSSMARFTSAFSRGIKSKSLAVLRGARVPAALVEIGYASHPVDSQNLLNPAYLERVAAGVAWGIRDFTIAQATKAKR